MPARPSAVGRFARPLLACLAVLVTIAAVTCAALVVTVIQWPRPVPPEAEQDEIYSLVIGEAEMRNREGSRVLLGLPAEVSMGDGLDDPTLWAPDRRTSAFLDYLWGTTFCWLSPPNARGYSHAFGKGVRTGTFEVLPVAPKTLHLRLSRIAFDATRTRAHVTLETANPALLFSAGWSVFLERSPAGSWRVASSELAWIT